MYSSRGGASVANNNAGPGYPTVVKPSFCYLPVVGMFCFTLMVIGLGLWIHFTSVAYNQCRKVLDIMGLQITNPQDLQIERVHNALVGTSIVWCLVTACVMALGVWRGMIESDQDLQGKVDDRSAIFQYICFSMQIAWFLLQTWLIFMIAGDFAFVSAMWILQHVFQTVLLTRSLMQRGTAAGSFPSYITELNCPTTCFNANAYDFVGVVDFDSDQIGCICDPTTLTDASEAMDTAFNASSGMMTGILFMFIFGTGFSYWLTGAFSHTRRELDINDRLSETKPLLR
mmetsp:Transcript_2718/g.5998  ORF Transcript_2718/g.5998 Transcript_2718/m.5998 type:complete len:286 (+) Transcript_2718:221-1078(+)